MSDNFRFGLSWLVFSLSFHLYGLELLWKHRKHFEKVFLNFGKSITLFWYSELGQRLNVRSMFEHHGPLDMELIFNVLASTCISDDFEVFYVLPLIMASIFWPLCWGDWSVTLFLMLVLIASCVVGNICEICMSTIYTSQPRVRGLPCTCRVHSA